MEFLPSFVYKVNDVGVVHYSEKTERLRKLFVGAPTNHIDKDEVE